METHLRYAGQVDDEGLKDDLAKTNAAQILKQAGIDDVNLL